MLQKQSLSLTTCHWDVLKQGGKFSGVSQPPSIRASLHSVLASALLKNSLAVEGLHDFLSFQSVCGWRTSSILLVEKPPLRSTILEVRINNEIQLTYKCSYSAGKKYFPLFWIAFSSFAYLLHLYISDSSDIFSKCESSLFVLLSQQWCLHWSSPMNAIVA